MFGKRKLIPRLAPAHHEPSAEVKAIALSTSVIIQQIEDVTGQLDDSRVRLLALVEEMRKRGAPA